MDDKTAELRDIFMDVTDDETVTEKQEVPRGSLTESDEEIDERVREVIGRMRDEFAFDSEFGDDRLATVAEAYYDGASDAETADRLGADVDAVVRARHDLHLLRDRETDAPFDLAELRDLLDGGESVAEMADRLGVAESTVRKYRRVVETRTEIRRVNGRFTDEFEELLTDADLQEQHTGDVKDDGLDEATDGMETDVSF
jgi:DNA-binding NarL/FixJ family response regulator